MSTFLSKDVQDGLAAARRGAARKSSRLRVLAGRAWYPVTRQWSGGFGVFVEDAPKLRGHVDLYDGARHMSRCLIVASAQEGDEIRYEYKRATAVSDRPPLDFYRAPDAPVGLITSD